MTASDGFAGELRQEILEIIVQAIADGIDAYEDTGTFPPRLGDLATDDAMALIAADRTRLIEAIEGEMPKEVMLPDRDLFPSTYWTKRGINACIKDVTAILQRYKTKPELPAQ